MRTDEIKRRFKIWTRIGIVTSLSFIILAVLVFICCSSRADEENGDPLVNMFLFHPTPYQADQWQEPNFKYREVWLTTSDKVKINAWYLEAEKPVAFVLFSHGNAGNLSDWGYAAEQLRTRFHVSVLIYDYRGFGKSEGKPSVPGILKDAQAARDWLCKENSLKPKDLIYQGRSLGGAVAVQLAAENGGKGLVVESSFSSLPAIAKEKLPFVPANAIIRYKLDSTEAIKKYNGPYLQCHGTADSVIPYQQGTDLFKVSPGKDKKFVKLERHDHNDPLPENYLKELGTFYNRIGKLPGTEPLKPAEVKEKRSGSSPGLSSSSSSS